MGWFRVLIETWWWVLLGALVGLVVGWLLGRLTRPRDVVDHPHFQALQGEFDDQRAELRATTARCEELERAATASAAEKAALATRLEACEGARLELEAVAASAPTSAVVADASAAVAAVTAGVAEAEPDTADAAPRAFAAASAEPAPVVFDAAAAAAAFGAKVVLDDLKIVEGIGPKIEELLHAANIRTWRELAAAPIDAVREVLRGGGDRFRMHDPSTWPEQAGLAADGRFVELKSLQDRLTAGRS
jgi:predicted flap endonuclease-1-like 5' DNA nuclease